MLNGCEVPYLMPDLYPKSMESLARMKAISNATSAIWVAGLVLPFAAHAGVFPYPISSHTLDNGLDIHVVQMNTPGVAAYATWMDVGSRDEVDVGRSGFAHFFEHLMFLGTPRFGAEARERALLRMAADDNAWTWFDETVYHTVLPSTSLEQVVMMEGDRFQHLTLTPDDVRREAGAVYGEYRKNKVSPGFLMYEGLYGSSFGTHTYLSLIHI